jgi:CTP:molybdopterin cytidylyltransferase MocA
VILAAGSGTRFQSPVPKLLAPVVQGQGMLELLLRSLLEDLQIPGDQLTVVVGGRSAPALAVLVNQIAPSMRLRRVAGNGSSGPMRSLAAALQDQPAPAARTWVLHGDTHYPRALLQRLLEEPIAHAPVLLLEPHATGSGAPEVGVQLNPSGHVMALGADANQHWPWRMLPAVGWSAGLTKRILKAGIDPLQQGWSQWQLLNALLHDQPKPTIAAVTVRNSGIFDVDTVPAWTEARRRFQCPP